MVTGSKESAQAVLIRAIEPVEGTKWMMERRGKLVLQPQLSAGPGVMSMAMGIKQIMDATSLLGDTSIWIEDRGANLLETEIVPSPRIGVDYAEECAHWLWRFYIKNNAWVSGK